MKTDLVLCIVLDAFRSSYMRDLPEFLAQLAEKGITAELIPTFGFEPDAAYVAGVYPEKCNGGMHYWYSPETSVFSWVPSWTKLINYLPYGVQLGVRHFIQTVNRFKENELGRKYFSRTARIPFDKLRYFDVVHSKLMFEKGFCEHPTIFDILRQNDIGWKYLGYPISSSSVKTIYKEIKSISLSEIDFLFCMIANFDSIGHKFGPHSPEITEELKHVDFYLKAIYDHVSEVKDNVKILIFGDHGMVEVNHLIDIQKRLDKLSSEPWKDYVYFLDSTFARFWFFDEKAEKEITDMLRNTPGGQIIDEEDKRHYHINYSHNKFGELIFWADGGRLIFPNFFQDKSPVKGMHGYRDEVRDNHSGFILFDPDREDGRQLNPVPMVDLFLMILDTLELSTFNSSGGSSILNRF